MIDKKEALGKCICKVCPSYVKCDENVAYCLGEKSWCIVKERGCLCPGCPVQAKTGFVHTFYCMRGPEKVQAKH